MFHPNGALRPFLVLILSLCGLWTFNLLPDKIPGTDFTIKKPDFFSALRKSPNVNQTNPLYAGKEAIKQSSRTGITDTVTTVQAISDKDIELIGMEHFFEMLRTKKKKIRVAWFGDSMVEGDLITQELRERWQKKYGGKGVGMVPITSITAGFRQSIKHSFSADWRQKSLLDKTDGKTALGITGFSFYPSLHSAFDTSHYLQKNESSWLMLKGSNHSSRLAEFELARLYFGALNGDAYITANYGNEEKTNVVLKGDKSVNFVDLKHGKSFQSLQLMFAGDSPLQLYGISLESDSGIFLDNLSFRGNSGMALTKIPGTVLQGFQEINDYDLIILQYGMNAVSSKVEDYSWYERGLDRMIQHMKNSFPNASFLFVSVGDKGLKQDGTVITDPGVIRVLEAERKVAEKNGIGFYNLFEAMGGYNSMARWAEGDTTYANKDYTHLNFRGAARISKLLHDKIEESYTEYCSKHRTSQAENAHIESAN